MGFTGTVLSWILLNKFGRRSIFLWGMIGLSSTLLILGGLTFPAETIDGAKWAQAALMLIWVFGFDLSVGPLAYGIVGEASSTRLRGKTVGLARNAYNICGTISGVLMSYMLNPQAWNWAGQYSLFSQHTWSAHLQTLIFPTFFLSL